VGSFKAEKPQKLREKEAGKKAAGRYLNTEKNSKKGVKGIVQRLNEQFAISRGQDGNRKKGKRGGRAGAGGGGGSTHANPGKITKGGGEKSEKKKLPRKNMGDEKIENAKEKEMGKGYPAQKSPHTVSEIMGNLHDAGGAFSSSQNFKVVAGGEGWGGKA